MEIATKTLSTGGGSEMQVSGLGGIVMNNTPLIQQYGFASNATNGSQILIFGLNEKERGKKFGIQLGTKFIDLKQGEVVMFNPVAKTYIFLKEDGKVLVKNNETNLQQALEIAFNQAIDTIITATQAITVVNPVMPAAPLPLTPAAQNALATAGTQAKQLAKTEIIKILAQS